MFGSNTRKVLPRWVVPVRRATRGGDADLSRQPAWSSPWFAFLCIAWTTLAALSFPSAVIGQPTNLKVLILWDTSSGGTLALRQGLEGAGISVTLSATDEAGYNGENPSPDAFDAVIHLNGTTFEAHMPSSGQQALVNYVQNGGGYVHGEWDAYEYQSGSAALMRDLILFDRVGGFFASITVSVAPGQRSHPVIARVPSTFSFQAAGNVGSIHAFSTDPAVVLMRDEFGSDAVAARAVGSGRVVGFHHAGNWDRLDTFADTNVQGLYVGAVTWASQSSNSPPRIFSPPLDQTVVAESTVVFDVGAKGAVPLSYQWLFNGTNLHGATNTTLLLTDVHVGHAGNYRAVVTNAWGSVTSTVATLTVQYALTVLVDGSGSVTRNPNQINYPPNFPVTLTAVPDPGAVFIQWSGDASGSANPLTLTLTSNTTITAHFLSTLGISLVGQGTVSKEPDLPYYSLGAQATLIAMPGRWHAFTHWGDGSTANPRVITIGTNNLYTAIFSPTTAVETLTFGQATRTAPVGMPAVLVDGEFVLTNTVTRLGSAEIEIRTTFPNGVIFFTFDGSEPSFFSRLYGGPIQLRHTTTVRATAWDAALLSSWEADAVRVIVDPAFTLEATTAGGGSINLSPSTAPYASNTVVTITAVPAPGWAFLQWLGDDMGADAAQSLRMTHNRCVQAVFGAPVSATVAGNGTVVTTPTAALYPYGTVVRFTGIPAAGHAFALWANAVTSTSNPIYFPVTNASSVLSAAFSPLDGSYFTLIALTDGLGTVTATPNANRYNSGAAVTLRALPGPEQSFLGWSGDGSGAENPLTVTMSQSKSLVGHFTRKPRLTLPLCGSTPQDGGFRLLLTGEWGARYRIEATEDLSLWSGVATATNVFGTLPFNDPAATNRITRFYRALLVP
jgi:hypothetical protein